MNNVNDDSTDRERELGELARWIQEAPPGATFVDLQGDERSRGLLEETWSRIERGELLSGGAAGGAGE